MRRKPLSPRLPGYAAALAIACGAAGCGLETAGLDTPDAASLPVSASSGDASVAPVGALDAAPGAPAKDGAASPPDAATTPTFADGAAPDVVLGDGTAPAPEGGGDPCDLDQDGFRASKQECGGNDCCDYDARAHPGEQAFFTTADACGSFDYDCSGSDEPEFAKVNCTIGVFACNGSGFEQSPPACGVVATFDACNLGLGCFTTARQQPQSCH